MFEGEALEARIVGLAAAEERQLPHVHHAARHRQILRAELEPPLPFPIEVRRNAGLVPSNCIHPDREFSRRCAIQTENPESALRLFASPAAREKAIEFLRDGGGSAILDEGGATTVVFDAQWKGAPAILRRVRDMVALVALLGRER